MLCYVKQVPQRPTLPRPSMNETCGEDRYWARLGTVRFESWQRSRRREAVSEIARGSQAGVTETEDDGVVLQISANALSGEKEKRFTSWYAGATGKSKPRDEF